MGICYDCQIIHEASAWWLSDGTECLWASSFSFTYLYQHVHSHYKDDHKDGTTCHNTLLYSLPRSDEIIGGESEVYTAEITSHHVCKMLWYMVVSECIFY